VFEQFGLQSTGTKMVRFQNSFVTVGVVMYVVGTPELGTRSFDELYHIISGHRIYGFPNGINQTFGTLTIIANEPPSVGTLQLVLWKDY